MSEGRSAYARADLEWYQEPPWVGERLRDVERFDGGAHDPACGVGTIPGVLESRGLPSSGADIVDRAGGKFALRDFLIPIRSSVRPNIICNPPASKLVAFVEQALRRVRAGRPGGGAAQMGSLANPLRPVFPPRNEANDHSFTPSLDPARRPSASQGRGDPQERLDRLWLVFVARRQNGSGRRDRVAQMTGIRGAMVASRRQA